MSDKRSRRRFLADMLFLGGGLTAAGLLARSQFSSPQPEPTPSYAPTPASTTAPPPVPQGSPPPLPAQEPIVEGKVKMPEPRECEKPPVTDPFSPKDTGAVVLPAPKIRPDPNPAGGYRPPPPAQGQR
jgi:hypothetical protein